MLLRLIESDKESFPDCFIKEADDGVTAIDVYKEEINNGGNFDFILMDYVMVINFMIWVLWNNTDR